MKLLLFILLTIAVLVNAWALSIVIDSPADAQEVPAAEPTPAAAPSPKPCIDPGYVRQQFQERQREYSQITARRVQLEENLAELLKEERALFGELRALMKLKAD